MGPLVDFDSLHASMEAALPILLPYLPHRSLLAVQGVCRSWCKTTLEEPSTWKVCDITRFRGQAAFMCDEQLLAWTKRARLCESVGTNEVCKNLGEKGSGAENLLMEVDLTGCVRLTGGGLLAALRDCTNLSKVRREGRVFEMKGD